ncbi:MAG: UDP-glucose/GDP-mannose dehydrogenase family protein [Dongiaceae bacterium]
MRIAIVGTGYVGLVSSACFSELGIETVGIDKDSAKLRSIGEGKMPIYEEGLEELVLRNVARGRLRFTDGLPAAVSRADVIFIAVGTPARDSDGRADLSAVFAVARAIAPHLTGYTVIATKSTVPVGTGRAVEREMRELSPDGDFDVASNPEFLREGAAIADFMNPDRILLGTNSKRAMRALAAVYRPMRERGIPIIETDRETAEISKYAANSFLATKIAFINEVADLCERVGGNVAQVAEAIGLDRRIGSSYLQAGPGFGGSCFPKDTRAFVATADEYGIEQNVVSMAIVANDRRKQRMANRIVEANGGNVRGKTIAILGLTFKANTDDMRDAASLVIVPALQAFGAHIRSYDPAANGQAVVLLPGIECCESAYDAAHDADSAVILTEWPEFGRLDLVRLYQRMKGRALIDLRNMYDPEAVQRAGFDYISIGRKPAFADSPAEGSRGGNTERRAGSA